MNTEVKSEHPTWLELESIIPLPKVEKITNLSRDGLQRHHPSKIVRLSPRRVGMKLRDALAIANGT
jgi:hypothetical protein